MYLTISSLGDSGWTEHKARVEYQCMQPHARDTTFTSCVCARICQTADINTATINSLPLFLCIANNVSFTSQSVVSLMRFALRSFHGAANLSVFVYEKTVVSIFMFPNTRHKMFAGFKILR